MKVCSFSFFLFFFTFLILFIAEFEAKYGRDTGLGCKNYHNYLKLIREDPWEEFSFQNLPSNLSYEEAFNLFSEVGDIAQLEVALPCKPTSRTKNLGFGYVRFVDGRSGPEAERKWSGNNYLRITRVEDRDEEVCVCF